MSENIKLGIEIAYETVLEAAEAFRKLDDELVRKQKQFGIVTKAAEGMGAKIEGIPLSRWAKDTNQYTYSINAFGNQMRIGVSKLKELEDAIKEQKEEFKLWDTTTKVTRGDLASLRDAFGSVIEKSWGLDYTLRAITKKTAEFSGGLGLTKTQALAVEKALKQSADGAAVLAAHFTRVNNRIGITNETSREFVAAMGASRMALLRFGQQIFWTSLGIMFVTMAFARLRRVQLSIIVTQESLRKSIMSLNRAKREAVEILQEYGAASEEYIMAQERIRDAQMNRMLAEERLRSALEQQYFATLMLAFGAFPTFLRLGVEVFRLVMLLTVSRALEAQATIDSGRADVYKAAMITGTVLPAEIAHVVVLKTKLATLIALTAAIGVGVAMALTYASMMATVSAEIDKVTRRTEELTSSMTGYSLVDAFYITEDVATRFGRIIRDLSEDTADLEIAIERTEYALTGGSVVRSFFKLKEETKDTDLRIVILEENARKLVYTLNEIPSELRTEVEADLPTEEVNALELAFAILSDTIKTSITGAFKIAGGVVSGFISGLSTAIEDIATTIEQEEPKISAAIDTVISTVATFFDKLAISIEQNVPIIADAIGRILDAVGNLATDIADSMIKNIDKIGVALWSIGKAIENNIYRVADAIEKVIEAVGFVSVDIANAMIFSIGLISESVVRIADAIKVNIYKVANAIVDLINAVGDVSTLISNAMVKNIHKIGDSVGAIIDAIGEEIVDSINKISGWGTDIVDAIAQGIIDNVTAVKDAIGDVLWHIITGCPGGGLEDMPIMGMKAGKALVDSMSQAISETALHPIELGTKMYVEPIIGNAGLNLGRGIGGTYYININATVRDDRDIELIKRALDDIIRSNTYASQGRVLETWH